MNLELRDWRALAIGWAAAIVAAIFGPVWLVPIVAIGVSMSCWAIWQS